MMDDFLKAKGIKAGERKALYRKRSHTAVTDAGVGAQLDEEAHDKHHEPEFEQDEAWPRRLMRWILKSRTV
jgi:hypothetical protein